MEGGEEGHLHVGRGGPGGGRVCAVRLSGGVLPLGTPNPAKLLRLHAPTIRVWGRGRGTYTPSFAGLAVGTVSAPIVLVSGMGRKAGRGGWDGWGEQLNTGVDNGAGRLGGSLATGEQ